MYLMKKNFHLLIYMKNIQYFHNNHNNFIEKIFYT